MIKKIIKDGYVIEFDQPVNLDKDTLKDLTDRAIKFAKKQETKDAQQPSLFHKSGEAVKKGDEVIDFRGEKAIVEGWEIPSREGKSGRVYVKHQNESGDGFTHGYYPEVFGLAWKGLPWQKEEVEDIKLEDNVAEEELESIVSSAMALAEKNPDASAEEIQSRTFAALDIGPGAYSPEDMLKISNAILEALKAKPAKIEDIPVNSPEEQVSITYTEKLPKGKNALTYGMIEEAFKQRGKDDGKTFAAYVDVAIDSLKEDIANAKYIVSGEMKPTRRLLLEDYIKIERLIDKAGMEDKLAEMRPLIDELSEKLDLNYWKQPKFKPQERKFASKELRAKHRWDSRIAKTVKPVFLCSESDLKASYNDAKQGKLPQVFEANLRKVEKDMEADYDRINQGRDNYLEDPRIVKTLPEIVGLYELAIKYAEDLGYKDIATRFAYMLNTIKKGWGLE